MGYLLKALHGIGLFILYTLAWIGFLQILKRVWPKAYWFILNMFEK